jgi:hypothetical protein
MERAPKRRRYQRTEASRRRCASSASSTLGDDRTRRIGGPTRGARSTPRSKSGVPERRSACSAVTPWRASNRCWSGWRRECDKAKSSRLAFKEPTMAAIYSSTGNQRLSSGTFCPNALLNEDRRRWLRGLALRLHRRRQRIAWPNARDEPYLQPMCRTVISSTRKLAGVVQQ